MMESGKLPNRGFMPEKHKHVHARQNSMRDKEWMMIRNKLISHLRHLTNQLKLLPSKRPKTRPYYQIKTGQIKYSPLPQLIGKGQFGSVYLFSMLDTVTQQEIKVAGKTLAKLGNDIYSLNQLYELIEEDRFEFHRELMMLAHIQKHKNFEFDKNKGKKLLTEYEIQYGQTQMGHENMLGFEGVYVPENCPPGFFDADYNYDLEIWCSGNNRESVKDPTAMQKITGKMLANMIMILPFYDGGDLKHLLENPKYSNNFLAYGSFVHLALGICKGLSFLNRNNVVHRDIACRNIMLKSKDPNNPWHQKPEDLTWLKGIKDEVDVKYNQLASSYIPVIIDVGLARIADINDFDTYKLKTPDLKLPIDYLAYESFVTDPNEFSLESDVWMLGVCLWEMSTYCRRKPYEKELRAFKQKSSKVYSNKVDLLKDYLGSGGRIELRHDMPKAIQSILSKCWIKNRNERIKPSKLIEEFEKTYRKTTNMSKIFDRTEITKASSCAIV